jgi:serine/threonine protein kinase
MTSVEEAMVQQCTYKICDFGLSRAFEVEETGGDKICGARGSITGGIGSALWMSPEVIATDRAQLDAHPFASDVHSYGVLAWQVLAGEQPYVGSETCRCLGTHQIKQLVVGGLRPETPQTVQEEREWGWPKGVARMMERCWVPRAETRPTFKEIVYTLQLLKGTFEPLRADAGR